MSRVNTESLLKVQPIQPNVTPIQIQPEYQSSQYTGGQIRVGQAQQQIGPTGNEALFQALAEMAGGVQTGINSFSNISLGIEKDRIKKAQITFNELNTKTELTPDQKQEEFDKLTRDIWTPVLGDDWRREMAVEVDRNWTSKEARNKYEEDRYKKDYLEWKTSNKNKDRPETNELYQEFNSLYESKYPSAAFNHWFMARRSAVDSAIIDEQNKQAVIDFNASIGVKLTFPSKEALNYYNQTINPTEQGQFKTDYPAYFELQDRIKGQPRAVAVETVQNYILDSFGQDLNKLTPEAQKAIKYGLDQIAQQKGKELFELVLSSNIHDLQVQSISNMATATYNLGIDKNIPSYLSSIVQNIGNISDPAKRFEAFSNIIPSIWQSFYQDTTSAGEEFRKKDINDQIKIITDSVSSWYQTNKELWKTLTGQDENGFNLYFLNGGRQSIINSENGGQRIVTTTLKNLKESATQTKNIFPLQNQNQIQKSIENFRINGANSLGIGVDSIQKLAYTGVGTPTPQFSASITLQDWYKSLSSEDKETLNKNGYTLNNFSKLEEFRTAYIDLETSARETLAKNTNNNNATSTTSAKTSEEIIQAFFTDPKIRAAGFTVSNLPINPDQPPDAETARTALLWQDLNQKFSAFLTERRTSNPEIGSFNLFTDEKGNLLSDPFDPESFTKNLTLDKTGSLTDEGKRNYLRLQFSAFTLASSLPKGPEKDAFISRSKDLLTNVSRAGFNDALRNNPQQLYTTSALLQGLYNGDPSLFSSSSFVGQDSEITKAMGAILLTMSESSSKIIDFTPKDQQGLNAEELTPDSLQMKILNSFRLAIDLFSPNISSKGSVKVAPLIDRGEGRNPPIEVGDVISEISTMVSTNGTTNDRETSITAFANRFRFGGINTFGEALESLLGSNIPKFTDSTSNYMVNLKNDDPNGINKRWKDLKPWERIQYYLDTLYQTDSTNTKVFLQSWFGIQNIDNLQDINTPLMFSQTGSYIYKNVLRPGTIEQTTQYRNRTFTRKDTPTGDPILKFDLVRDGKLVSRQALFEQANGMAYNDVMVGTQRQTNNWISNGESKPITVTLNDGTIKTGTSIQGQVHSEDEFVVTQQLAKPLRPTNQDYEYYKWWAETLRKTPVTKQEFYDKVQKLTPNNTRYVLTGLMTKRPESTIPGTTQTFGLGVPLFDVISSLHQEDLTESNVGIFVESDGTMAFDIGDNRYRFTKAPPYESKTQWSNTKDLNNFRTEQQFHVNRLEQQRARKRMIDSQRLDANRIYAAIALPTDTNTPTVLRLDYLKQQYELEAGKKEDPSNWKLQNPFNTWWRTQE